MGRNISRPFLNAQQSALLHLFTPSSESREDELPRAHRNGDSFKVTTGHYDGINIQPAAVNGAPRCAFLSQGTSFLFLSRGNKIKRGRGRQPLSSRGLIKREPRLPRSVKSGVSTPPPGFTYPFSVIHQRIRSRERLWRACTMQHPRARPMFSMLAASLYLRVSR